ncbi:MAG: biopolymer transporter ExbD [Bacteroidales bacterium]|nr:biopolymer transporter ExbD [Bacteroidales bacterium]MBO7566110.1 biopolymer transporter ExbD [Bacteroidales bacterium]MBP5682933.1 biopolymer transporter ExbD [Bacteroidales bacterium]
MAKKVGDLNASSQADIAFLLLIFFLVTTSMNVDQGLYRQLPPPVQDENQNHDKVNERNIFIVLINKDNQLAIEGEQADISSLTERTIEFITNPKDKADLAEKVPASKKLEDATNENKAEDAKNWKKVIDQFGDIGITKGVVSLQNDRGTNYETYIAVQNAIVAAYNITRDKFSQEQFGKVFDELSNDEQKLVKLVIPLNISEAEPRSIK